MTGVGIGSGRCDWRIAEWIPFSEGPPRGARVSIPGYQTFMLPLLQLSADGDIHTSTEAIENLAAAYSISPEERKQLLPSGRGQLFYNRVHWALTYLRHAGLLQAAGRARFQITERGRSVLREAPSSIDRHYLTRYPEFLEFLGASPAADSTRTVPAATADTADLLNPDERLEAVYRELRLDVERDLIERLQSGSPLFFERAVLAVLVGMNYGGSRADAAEHLGRPGDEGLDGVINEDRLGLDKIYVQAKRYTSPVGQDAVRGFAGSLDGAHARKGVFITTSTFAPTAREWVARIDKTIVLIDGPELARLMVDHEVGVQRKAEYRVYRIDDDFFETTD
jgi:restriction system protein